MIPVRVAQERNTRGAADFTKRSHQRSSPDAYIDAAKFVEKLSRSSCTFYSTVSLRPGSKIGITPAQSADIFAPSRSTQATAWPNSEKQAAETSPTYPLPIIAIPLRLLTLFVGDFVSRDLKLGNVSLDRRSVPAADNGLKACARKW